MCKRNEETLRQDCSIVTGSLWVFEVTIPTDKERDAAAGYECATWRYFDKKCCLFTCFPPTDFVLLSAGKYGWDLKGKKEWVFFFYTWTIFIQEVNLLQSVKPIDHTLPAHYRRDSLAEGEEIFFCCFCFSAHLCMNCSPLRAKQQQPLSTMQGGDVSETPLSLNKQCLVCVFSVSCIMITYKTHPLMSRVFPQGFEGKHRRNEQRRATNLLLHLTR